jgi:hypothetical protein
MPATRKGTIANEVVGASLKTLSFLPITDLSAVVGITSPDANTIEAQIQAESVDVRYRTDGNDPTASVGHLLAAGDTLFLTGLADITAFKAIQTSAGAKLNITLRG